MHVVEPHRVGGIGSDGDWKRRRVRVDHEVLDRLANRLGIGFERAGLGQDIQGGVSEVVVSVGVRSIGIFPFGLGG